MIEKIEANHKIGIDKETRSLISLAWIEFCSFIVETETAKSHQRPRIDFPVKV